MAKASRPDRQSRLQPRLEPIKPGSQAHADVRPPTAPGQERTPAQGRIAAPAEPQPFDRWLRPQSDVEGLNGSPDVTPDRWRARADADG